MQRFSGEGLMSVGCMERSVLHAFGQRLGHAWAAMVRLRATSARRAG